MDQKIKELAEKLCAEGPSYPTAEYYEKLIRAGLALKEQE